MGSRWSHQRRRRRWDAITRDDDSRSVRSCAKSLRDALSRLGHVPEVDEHRDRNHDAVRCLSIGEDGCCLARQARRTLDIPDDGVLRVLT